MEEWSLRHGDVFQQIVKIPLQFSEGIVACACFLYDEKSIGVKKVDSLAGQGQRSIEKTVNSLFTNPVAGC